nr:pentapeptide repeat-containing protein [Kibdelosporangium phytohabitans]
MRRQRSGTQYGADIVIRFKGAALDASSTCLVECKNYSANPGGLTVSTVADKVLQAEANFDAEPVDHWILVSPDLDPNNELDRLVERWNATRRFPFAIQIWSPQTGVKELFAAEPGIYRDLYGHEPPRPQRNASDVLAEFAERLHPPVRLPQRLSHYLQNKVSFVEQNERGWLDQLNRQIERFGFNERGARLGRPLEVEILSVLVDSPIGSNVALLLAEFGEGKSFFTVSLCVHLQERYLREPRSDVPIPIRLHLRGYRFVSSPADFLANQLGNAGLETTDWADLRRRNVLVILDGLDEMSVRQDPATIRDNLNKVASLLELLEGFPVLVTSRPHFFASSAERELFYDRLRRPHVFRMGQPDRRVTVDHLRAYADSLNLGQKLNKIKELYDPIGLAGKVLFLEMIKKTLPELPEDHFDELILYNTYVQGSLTRKKELLRDPASAMQDSDLIANLEKLLEMIAIRIHESGEGNVDLQEFVGSSGGAARILWHASRLDSIHQDSDADASARIGSRSLLRRVGSDDDRWLVDFFHRSMKEYFIAKALHRALRSADPFAETRRLLLQVPVQPEILGFFRLLVGHNQDAATVLASLTHSARVGFGHGLLGGGAISLYHAAGGQLAGLEWRSLQLDGAVLVGADLSGCDFQGSTLRGADLSSTDLTGADFRSADLTGANLDVGSSVISLAPDASPRAFFSLTKDCKLGRISFQADGSLKFSIIQLPRTLRWPDNVHLLKEDLVLVTAHSEFLIVDISEGTTTEIAYFRVLSELRSAAVVDQALGLLNEPEYGDSEALLIDIATSEVRWRVPVRVRGGVCSWLTNGILIAAEELLLLLRDDRSGTMGPRDHEAPATAVCVHEDQVILATDDGRETWLSLNSLGKPECTLAVHSGAGTAVTVADGTVLSSGVDGSLAVTARDTNGSPTVVTRVERRLLCTGARVEGMQGEREFDLFVANGADR